MNTYVKVENENELNAVVAIVGLKDVEYESICDIFCLKKVSKPEFVEIFISDGYKVGNIAKSVAVPSTIYSFLDFMENYKEIIDSVTVEK